MEKRANSLVIKIDGIDGSGKTMLVVNLAKVLRRIGLKVCTTAEFRSPFDSPSSPTLRLKRLALSESHDIDEIERQMLWIVNSRRHNRVIIPRLRKDYDCVIGDRSSLSTIAYGNVLVDNFPHFLDVNRLVEDSADIIFWLDTPVKVCMARLCGKKRDRIERLGASFFRRVRAQFAELSVNDSRIVTLTGGSFNKTINHTLSELFRLRPEWTNHMPAKTDTAREEVFGRQANANQNSSSN